MNAEILSVGTELLLGSVTNTDARDLSEALAGIGINVYWHTVVGDNPERLMQAIDIARFRADLIITTGGLGPTCDDLTKQTLARAFGLELYRDAAEEAYLREWFANRPDHPFTENNLRQADLPVGCTVFHNVRGTAPGCAFQKDGKTVMMFPGPPRECLPLFRDCGIPYLAAQADHIILSREVHMVGIGESRMEEKLRDMMEGLRNPTLAPYCHTGECYVRITAKAGSEEECNTMMEPVLREVEERLGDYIYGIDVDSLEQTASELLREHRATLAAAESCTGGLLAKRMTDLPGASDVFLGGTTVYTVKAKEELLGVDPELIAEHGVVSAAVAAKMAKRIRKKLGATLGVGITGWAGPDGDDVGLVYVALARRGECFVRRLVCGKVSRDMIRTMAVNNALDMVCRSLRGREL